MTKYFLSFFHFQILTSPACQHYQLSQVTIGKFSKVNCVHILFQEMFRFALLATLSYFENQEEKCGSAIDFEFLMSTTDGAKRVRYG